MAKLIDYIDKIIDNRGKNPNYLQIGKYPVIDNVAIGGRMYPDKSKITRYIDEYTYKNFLRGYISQNMPIMTLVGNGIGNVSLAPAYPAVIVQNTIGFKTKKDLDQIFLYYYLKYRNQTIRNFNRGSGQPSVKKGDVLSLEVSFPDIKIQNKIATTLFSIDKKIELNNEINDNLYTYCLANQPSRFDTSRRCSL